MFESGLIIEASMDMIVLQTGSCFHDMMLVVVSLVFSGSIYKDKAKMNLKYMNSPESSIFIKGDTLYNYHRVGEA